MVETIEWKMPVFRRGERWIAMASQKAYVALYLGSGGAWAATIAATDPKLAHGKGCVTVRDNVAMPMAAITAAVEAVLA